MLMNIRHLLLRSRSRGWCWCANGWVVVEGLLQVSVQSTDIIVEVGRIPAVEVGIEDFSTIVDVRVGFCRCGVQLVGEVDLGSNSGEESRKHDSHWNLHLVSSNRNVNCSVIWMTYLGRLR